ncbi:MAG: hypothetical protein NTU49_07125 [Gammaproteobacteria bacterium]|nr:hypothetical protein [Gammaproteobacteria bacterium]
MRKFLFIGLASVSAITTSYADVTVHVTASSIVSNVPADFAGNNQFGLERPWEFDMIPHFPISATPASSTLVVPAANNIPVLELRDHVPPNAGLTWLYDCDGLTFNYNNSTNETATIVFTGTINAQQPGTGVECICSGSACSTTLPVPAKLVIR